MQFSRNPLDQAAEALERLGDSSRTTSDLGIDPGAPPVLEVIELWGDAVLDVRHFGSGDDQVRLGDPRHRGLRPWSSALIALLLVGVGLLVTRHASLDEPPRLVDGDQQILDDWDAAAESERAAIIQAARLRSESDEPEPEPEVEELPDPLADARNAWNSHARSEHERLVKAGADPMEILAAIQPFSFEALPDHRALLVDEMLPIARQQAPEGRLKRGWIQLFERFDAQDPVIDTELAELLYTDAVVRRAISQRCRALARLVADGGLAGSFEHQARQAQCLHRRGLPDEAAPFAARAIELRPESPTDDAEAEDIAGVLRIRAELADRDPALLAASLAEWQELRTFTIDELQDGGLLGVADAGIYRVRAAELDGRQDRLVRAALVLGFLVAMMLPFGFVLDERRNRRGAPHFEVPSWDLPEAPFRLVERDGDDLLVAFEKDGVARLDVGEERLFTADLAALPRTEDIGGWLRAPLPEGGRFMVQLGGRVFVVRLTERAKLAPTTVIDDVDWRFAGIMAAVLLLGVSVAILGQIVQLPGSTEILTRPDFQTVSLAPAITELPEMSGSDEGEKAKDEEGAMGDPRSRDKAPKARLAMRKSERDRDLVNDIIADVIGDSIYDMGGSVDGLDQLLAGLSASPIPGYGPGAGVRGPGPGGGGTRPFGGIGINDLGIGGPGGPGPGPYTSLPKKKERGPMVKTGGPITLSPIDKSAVDRVVKSHLSQIRYCYQKELTKNPELNGKIVIKFVIGRDGSTSQASVKSSTMNNPIVEQCIVSKFMRMRFPKPKGGGLVIVSYPFVFDSAG